MGEKCPGKVIGSDEPREATGQCDGCGGGRATRAHTCEHTCAGVLMRVF